jgi:glutaminyl-peptide cyclotransferase
MASASKCIDRMQAHRILFFFLLGMLAFISPRPYMPTVAARPSGAFDGTRAFAHLRRLVEMGPRFSGSPGQRQAQEYIMNELSRCNIKVKEQVYKLKTPRGPQTMKNIIGMIPGISDEVIILGTHYDTKYLEGIEIVGANDGASGPSVVLELAECLSRKTPEPSIWLVFFDGEESFGKNVPSDCLYGSRYFLHDLKLSGSIAKVKAAIILDMVGDAHLGLEKEYFSAKWLTDIVWRNARRLGHEKQFIDIRSYTNGDHIPFVNENIPVLSLNDFHYGSWWHANTYWHSAEDTLDKVSRYSLETVGEVVLASLPEIAAN